MADRELERFIEGRLDAAAKELREQVLYDLMQQALYGEGKPEPMEGFVNDSEDSHDKPR